MLSRLICWTLMFGLYLALDPRAGWPRLVAGAAVAAVATLTLHQTSRQLERRLNLHPRLQWLTIFISVPLEIVRDLGVLALALWEQMVQRETVEGNFRNKRPKVDGALRYRGIGRAMVALKIGWPPNTYALAFDPPIDPDASPQKAEDQEVHVLIHELLPREERGIAH